MTKYKPNKTLRTWLESKSVVAIGYYDQVKAVNLDYLLACWVDITVEQKETLEDNYPYAADHTQVMVIEKDDPRNEQGGILQKVVSEFRHCPHLKIWSEGEVVEEQLIQEIADSIYAAQVRSVR